MTRITGPAALGRASDFGAPAIGGVDADVLAFDAFTRDQALRIVPASRPGAGAIQEWAVAFDVFIPQPAGRFVALLQTGATTSDADLFLRDNGDGTAGIGISSVYQGAVPFGAWARIAATFTVENGQTVLRKYVNGELAGEQTLGASTRWAIDPAQGLALFTDEDGETAPGLVSSVFFTTEVPSADQVAAILAAAPTPDAAGFFPAAPSEGAVEIGFANADVQPRYGSAAVIVEGGDFRTPVAQGDSQLAYASQFGIAGPGGVDVPVLKHPAFAQDEGLIVTPPAGLGPVSSYTMVWDVRVGALPSGWYALLQTDLGNTNDGDFFIRTAGGRGIGIGGDYTGSVPVDEWSRIALTIEDQGNGQSQMIKFIDGVEVGRQTVDAARFTLKPEGFRILADEDGEVSPGYIAHFGVRVGALSPAEVAALGGADADGPFSAADPQAAQIGFDGYAPTVEFGGLEAELRDLTPVPAPAVPNPVRDMLIAEGAEAVTIDLEAVFGAGASGFKVETSNGQSVEATIENGVLTLNFGALGAADVTVTAIDAFGREVSDEFRARVAGEGAYTIAILPDTQNYSGSATIGQTYNNMTQWLADNAQARNLAFVTHVGDVAGDATVREFQNAQAAQQLLRDAGIPFTLTLGNHDFGPGGSASNRDTGNFNSVFTQEYMSKDPTYAGAYDQEPGRYDNNYHLIDAPDGTGWIVLNLEFGPRDDVLRWANDVLDQHADRKAMVMNHSYLNWDGRHDSLGGPLLGEGAGYDYGIGNDPRGAQDGETIWRDVLSKHANVVFVAGGHIFGDGAETLTSYNQYGQPVHQFLVNYQNGVAREITGNGDPALPTNGGNGAIRLVIVDPKNNAVYTETYFTEFDTYLTGGRGEDMSRDGLTGAYVGHEETILNAGVGVREALARADAGDDQLIEADGQSATVTLSASRTTNPKADIVSQVWTDADGRVVAEGANPTLTLPGGKHDFTLTVTTAGGVTTTDTVRVIVKSDDVWLAETFNDGDADGWAPPVAATPALAEVGTDLGFTLPSISGAEQRILTISFDSHWRPENNQTGQLLVGIDGAAPAELLRLDSVTTRDDGSNLNERITISFNAPVNAQSLNLFWKMSDAGNNWYWAIDNVVVTDESGAVVMAENFDGLADRLKPAVDENIPADVLGWTHETPEGWSIDTPASVPQGATEWQGWSFTTLPFWTAADGQGRADFTRAENVFAVVDPDEWDDFNEGSATGRDFESTLSVRVDLGGQGAGADAVGVARIDALGRQHAIKVTPGAEGKFAEYTLVYDIYVPGGQGNWTSLLQTDLTNASDGELFIRNRGDCTGGVGISSVYTGDVRYDAWNRVAFVFTVENGAQVLRKYVDGVFAGQQTVDGNIADGSRWILDADQGFYLMADNDGDVSQSYLSAFAFTPKALTAGELAAMGGVDAAGPLTAAGQPEGAFQLDFSGALDALSFGEAAVAQVSLGSAGTPFVVKGSANSRPGGDGLPAPEGKLFDQSNAPDNVLIWKDGDWADLVMEATLMSLDDDAMGVVFRYIDAANHYLLKLDNQGDTRTLIRVTDGVETVLAKEAGGYRFYDDIELKLWAVGGRIAVSLDGVALFGGPVADDAPLSGGTVGVYSSQQKSSVFDDIVVRAPRLEAEAGPRKLVIDWEGDGIETVRLDGSMSVGAEGAAAKWTTAAGAVVGALAGQTALAAGRTVVDLSLTKGAAASGDAVIVDVASGDRLIAADRFEDGDHAGWRIIDTTEIGGGADWAVVDGRLVERSGAYSRELTWAGASNTDVWKQGWSPLGDGTYALHKGSYALWEADMTLENFSIEAVVNVPTTGGVGFMLGWIDENNYYKLEIDARVNLTTLVKVVEGYETYIARVRGGYTLDDVFHLRAERVDQTFQVWIDGHEIFHERLEDRDLGAGAAGLYAWGAAGVSFDDVAIVDLSTPFETAATVFTGTDRNDSFKGTEAADVFIFGAGNDVAFGAGGADRFVFGDSLSNGLREMKQIRDYDAEQGDVIDLGGHAIHSVRETAASVTLTMAGDLDQIVIRGVSRFDQIIFADDLLLT